MPATHIVSIAPQIPIYTVNRKGKHEPVNILKEDGERVYVNYINLEKRLDEWVPLGALIPIPAPTPNQDASSSSTQDPSNSQNSTATNQAGSKKRKRTPSTSAPSTPTPVPESLPNPQPTQEIEMTEEDYDIQHHQKQIGAVRNFDRVHFGKWNIRTWYYSPYPFSENEEPDGPTRPSGSGAGGGGSGGGGGALGGAGVRVAGPTGNRKHARTSDLLAGGLGRVVKEGEKSILWVCEMCFKYMIDGISWEGHKKVCQVKHPPGRKVYQRGAHTIWEVDGAKEKLYCQNLSLFGKLFIDIKTLFFDLDNFLFYILTDASAEKDHMMGYFCKEKVSFDGYNLACITTLPPYQKQGFGMLMIEFSYELSRRSGTIGTPERPLSDLGLRSYLAYWVATLVRFFRKLLTVLPQGTSQIQTTGSPPDFSGRMLGNGASEGREDSISDSLSPTSSASSQNTANPNASKKKKKHKGWDGELPITYPSHPHSPSHPSYPHHPSSPHATAEADMIHIPPSLSAQKTFVVNGNEDGSAVMNVCVRCTLEDVGKATGLRVEDAAFALGEMGLLRRWGAAGSGSGSSSGVNSGGQGVGAGLEGYEIVVTRERVEQIAAERNVKHPCILMKHVLL